MDEMSAMQISAMLGQWVGAAFCMVAVVVTLKGIYIEYQYKADKGFKYITIGSVCGLIGGFIFAIATKLVGF